MDGCHVPDNGKEGGWDVIFQKESGIMLPEDDQVHTVYVEMKNKHNTMNSSAAAKTYIKMQNQLLADDDCACFLVEAIAKKSQNIKWSTTVDGKSVSHKKIRRVSLDQFYALVTGQADAFYQMCMALPQVIESVIAEDGSGIRVPHDTVLEELRQIADQIEGIDGSLAMVMAVYLLGFHTYEGFSQAAVSVAEEESGDLLKRLYGYAKKMNSKK